MVKGGDTSCVLEAMGGGGAEGWWDQRSLSPQPSEGLIERVGWLR